MISTQAYAIYLFFFIFEREVNVTETNNTDAKIYGVSFQTTWLTAENSKCMSFRL